MTCHNRRETTLRCLESLALEKRVGVGQWKIDVFLVDDGSTDGTREEVGELSGSGSGNGSGSGSGSGSGRIHLIEGDGTLFWAKGMELAWRTALEEEKLHCPTPTHISLSYLPLISPTHLSPLITWQTKCTQLTNAARTPQFRRRYNHRSWRHQPFGLPSIAHRSRKDNPFKLGRLG